jgi:hypothetical protein
MMIVLQDILNYNVSWLKELVLQDMWGPVDKIGQP